MGAPGTRLRLLRSGSGDRFLRTHECRTRDHQCRTRTHEHRHQHRQNTARTCECSTHDHQRSAPDSIIQAFVPTNAAFDTTSAALILTTQLPCPQSSGGMSTVVESVNKSKASRINCLTRLTMAARGTGELGTGNWGLATGDWQNCPLSTGHRPLGTGNGLHPENPLHTMVYRSRFAGRERAVFPHRSGVCSGYGADDGAGQRFERQQHGCLQRNNPNSGRCGTELPRADEADQSIGRGSAGARCDSDHP